MQTQFLGAVTKQMPLMIVTEFMPGGSLSDLFRSQRLPNMWRAIQLALDCAKGMAYLHNRTPQVGQLPVCLGVTRSYAGSQHTAIWLPIGWGGRANSIHEYMSHFAYAARL